MLATVIITAAAVATALGVLWALGRKLVKRARAGLSKVGAASDALLGREAVLHPDTGEELVPATPGLGVRLNGLETAVTQMAQTQADVAALSQQVTDLTSVMHAHLTYAEGHDREVWAAIQALTARIPTPPQSAEHE